MAAFSFPQNPQNGDTETNPATGIKYVFVALPAPGKWEVQMQSADSDYVNVTGDTMTGPLDIVPSAVIPASTQDSTLMIKAAPFSQAASDQNYISRVFEAKTNQDHTIFGIRNSDATNLPITQGRLSSITAYAADFLTQPSLNSITADDFPNSGLRAGFRIGGRQEGGASGNVLDCTYFDTEGTQINYYGDMLTENSLVTKAYVDTASGEGSLIHGGTIAEGSEGSISGSGNLAIQRSSTAKGGNLYVRTSSGANLIAAEQPGKLNITPNAVVGGGILNIVSVYSADNSSNYAAKFRYKDSGGTENVYLQVNANTQLLEYTGEVRVRGDLKIQTTGSVSNITLTNTGNITANGVVTIAGGQSEFFKERGADGDRDFVIYGTTTEKPTTGTEVLFGTYRNTLSNATQADAIAYFGKTDGAANIQTKTSVEALIENAVPSSVPTDFSFNDLAVTGTLSGSPGGGSGSLDIVTDTLTCDGQGTFNANLKCNTFNALNGGTFSGSGSSVEYIFNGGTVTFMNRGVKNYSGLMQTNKDTDYLMGNNTKYTYYPDTSKTDYQGTPIDPLLVINGRNKYTDIRRSLRIPSYVSISQEASGTNKDCFLNIGDGTFAINKNTNTTISTSNTVVYFTKAGFAAYQDITMLNSSKVTGLPNPTSGTDAANKNYVDTTTITSVNTPTGVGDVQGATVSSTALTISRPYESSTAGRGFTLTGNTLDQPSNSSAIMLALQHYASGQADDVLYYGGVSDNQSLQTRQSVNSLISSALNNTSTLPSNWNFYNQSSSNTSSQLTGYWTLQWAADNNTAIVIIKATNDSADGNITSGTYVSVIPNAIKPAATVVARLASRDGMTTADAVISPTNGFIIIRNVQGAGNTRLEGQLIYSLHSS